MNEQIVVMSGSFNPPTIAHMKLMQAAMDRLGADMGFMVPASYAYVKRKLVKAGDGRLCIPDAARVEMLRAMCADDPRIHICEEGLDEPFSVTEQMLARIQARHPEAKLWFVAGTDKLALLETFQIKWGFLTKYGSVIFDRGDKMETELQKWPELWDHRASIVSVESPEEIAGISSTAVRKHMFAPDVVKNMLHPAVLPLVRQLKEADFPEEIHSFKGEFAFLDIDYPSPVKYEEIVYPNVRSAFIASQITDIRERRRVASMSINKVRERFGRLDSYLGEEKAQGNTLREIIRLKFDQAAELRNRLIATGDRRLIYGGKGKADILLGMDTTTWSGENQLGKLLMALREEYQHEIQS